MSTLESVTCSKQVDRKFLRMTIIDLKKRLIKGDATSYAWLPMERMWANLLTKEKRLPEKLEDVLLRNEMNLQDTRIN